MDAHRACSLLRRIPGMSNAGTRRSDAGKRPVSTNTGSGGSCPRRRLRGDQPSPCPAWQPLQSGAVAFSCCVAMGRGGACDGFRETRVASWPVRCRRTGQGAAQRHRRPTRPTLEKTADRQAGTDPRRPSLYRGRYRRLGLARARPALAVGPANVPCDQGITSRYRFRGRFWPKPNTRWSALMCGMAG